MFKTIVVGLDGSNGSRKAIPFATELARRDGAKLVIAHVAEHTIGKGGGTIRANEDEIRAELEQLASDLGDDGVETSFRTEDIRIGGPAHAIDEIADSVGADLIVVGTQGHTALANMLIGSVAQRLLSISKCPVFVVPEGASSASGAGNAASTSATVAS